MVFVVFFKSMGLGGGGREVCESEVEVVYEFLLVRFF